MLYLKQGADQGAGIRTGSIYLWRERERGLLKGKKWRGFSIYTVEDFKEEK